MTELGDIKTFKISNGALKSDRLPSRLKILGWGDNQTVDGIYRAGDQTGAQLTANQKRLGFERVAIDFDHCTVPGSETYKEVMKNGQVPPIFGYGRVNPIPGDGVYLEEIAWTPLGVLHARNFEDISPALIDKDREVTLIHSIALTPNGKVDGLHFFSVNTNPTMKKITDNITGEDLAKLIGLPANATLENLQGRLTTLSALAGIVSFDDKGAIKTFSSLIKDGSVIVLGDVPDRLKKLEDAGTKQIAILSAKIDGKDYTFTAEDVVKLAARLETLENTIKDDKTAAMGEERNVLIKRFAADGKVPKKADGAAYSADELKGLDVGILRLLHANTPVTVALSARPGLLGADGNTKQHRYKGADGKEVVDLAGIFDEENSRAGLSLNPN